MSTFNSGSGNETFPATDFWLFFEAMHERNDSFILDAIAALYFLPEAFKLMIADDYQMPAGWQNDLQTRVRNHETGQAAPFSIGATLYAEQYPRHTEPLPAIVIAKDVGQDLTFILPNRFTVRAGSPEAIATATLRLASITT